MKTLFVVLLLCSAAMCQFPRPYVAGSFNLMPAGYAPFAFGFGGGVMWDTSHVVFDSFLGYDNGHKENDATSNNNKGHDRFARGFLSYKQGSNYFGVGARWSQLSTTNYKKGGAIYSTGAWHPEIGVGHDFNADGEFSPLFMRAQFAYMFKESKESINYPDGTVCAGCGNGSQGADISLWFPSPARKSHVFFRINAVIFRFHDTFTDPTNVYLTDIQKAHTHWADSTEFLLMYRF